METENRFDRNWKISSIPNDGSEDHMQLKFSIEVTLGSKEYKIPVEKLSTIFCTMRDLNEGADSNRSQQYGDRASGSHPNSHGQQTRQPNRYPRFDRGCIRQIMLVQNATFTTQVYELHHLYNRQKELMEELKKKEPYGYLRADTSQSNSYASPIPSDATNKMQHVPRLPAASTSYTKEPVAMNDKKVVPINFLKGSSVQSGPVFIGERSTQENDLMDSKHKRHSRRMYDLLLPADVYIDCEDAEKSDKEIVDESSSVNMFPLNSTQDADHENDVKLSLGTSEGPNYGEDGWKSDSCTKNGVIARRLEDLNEPVEENFSDRAGGSVAYNFVSQRIGFEENQGHHLPSSTRSAFFRAGHNEQGTHLNLLHADKKEIIQERWFFNNEAGKNKATMELFSTGSSKEDLSISSEPPQPKFKKPVEILSPNRSKRGMSIRENQGQGIEISGRRTPHDQRTTAPSVPSPFSAFPGRDYNKVQNGSSHSPLAAQSSSYRSGCNNGTMDNSTLPSQLNLPQIVFGKQKLNCSVDSNTERHGPSSLSGLRRIPASISSHMAYQGTEISLRDISSISQERRKSEAYDGPSSKRLFGVSISDGTGQSPALSAPRGGEQPVTGSTKCSRKDEKKAASSKTQKRSSSSSRGLRNCINLNSEPSSWEMVDSEAPVGISSRPDEALAKEAAENILWMFSSKEQSHLDNISSDGRSDTLHWFAEVVSGLDQFEQMTLELEETKPEDYLCKPWKEEDQKEDGGSGGRKSNAASLLLTKPRRGQRKKRRDFQRDILPALASLSRREVAEDIRTFAALMKASGQSWQSGATKRNGGRNVAKNSRARPRQQAGSSAASPAPEVAVEARETNNNNTEVEVEGGNIRGWGRTTTRCRRQRWPSATNAPASSIT